MAIQYRTSNEDTALLREITRRLAQDVKHWYGRSATLLASQPEVRCFTNSFLIRYPIRMETGEKAVVLKIRRHPKMPALSQAVGAPELHTQIPSEYEALRYVHQRMGTNSSSFTAIRPLTYFEDFFAIVMEEFSSHSLRHLLHEQRSGRVRSTRVPPVQITQRAGELVRFFHTRIHPSTHQLYTRRDILDEVEPLVAKLERCTQQRVNARSILNAFLQKLESDKTRMIETSMIHQDLTCDNILYSDEGCVCLIDIKTKPGPIYSDLALLLVHPQTFRDHIFRAGRYFPPTLLQNYQGAILKGYFSDATVDRFLLNLFCAIRVLDKWSMHEELLHRYKGLKRALTRPFSPLITSYFQKLFQGYMQAAAEPM